MSTRITPEDVVFDATATERMSYITPWETVEVHVRKLLQLQDNWDGAGALGVRQEIVCSAIHLAKQLAGQGTPAPQDVYPLPDGNIILEWQYQDGRIDRIEIESVGLGQKMTTYPDPTKEADFSELRWPLARSSESQISFCSDSAQILGDHVLNGRAERSEFLVCSGFDLAA